MVTFTTSQHLSAKGVAGGRFNVTDCDLEQGRLARGPYWTDNGNQEETRRFQGAAPVLRVARSVTVRAATVRERTAKREGSA